MNPEKPNRHLNQVSLEDLLSTYGVTTPDDALAKELDRKKAQSTTHFGRTEQEIEQDLSAEVDRSEYLNKVTIENALDAYGNNMMLHDVYEELDRLYAQAPKADEYEAKAKAWDLYMAHCENYGKTYYEITRAVIAQEMNHILEQVKEGDA